MQTITNIFQGTAPWVMGIQGFNFQILDSVGPVDLRLTKGGATVSYAKGVQSGFKINRKEYFDGFVIENALVGSSVTVFAGADSSAEYTRIAGVVDARIKTAKTLLNKPMISALQNVEALICSANESRASLRVWNNGTADVYIGAPGLIIADAAIKLAPGEMWTEETAAGCTWVVLHSNAAAQAIKSQEAIY